MIRKKVRCPWCIGDSLYQDYHDKEWGVPTFDDRVLFEFLTLETFQAGLSWLTILKKRNNFRRAFDGFDYQKIAIYNQEKINQLLLDRSIVRNKLKIHALINNAEAFINVQKESGSFSNYLWSWVNRKQIVNRFEKLEDIPVHTELARAISADLKKRGFRFVGPTIVYSKMQAIGMVNDHLLSCFRHKQVQTVTESPNDLKFQNRKK